MLSMTGAGASPYGTWTNVADNGSGDQFVTALTCFTNMRCVATSGFNDDVFVTSDGGMNWSLFHSEENVVEQNEINCESNGTCYILSTLVNSERKYDGVAISESKDGGENWKKVYVSKVPVEKGSIPTYQLNSMSCPIASNCVVAGNEGDSSFVLRTPNGGVSWTKSMVSGSSFDSIACPSVTICYGVTGVNNTNVYKSIDGGTKWSEMAIPAGFLNGPGDTPTKRFNLFSITCRSVVNCVAGGELAAVSASASVQPIYPLIWGMVNGKNWLFNGVIETTPDSTPKYQSYIDWGSITCPRAHYCFAGISYGKVVDITFLNGKMNVSEDSASLLAPYLPLTNLDCPTVTFCVAAAVLPNDAPEFGRLPIDAGP
jgi:hypothetical protein